MSEQCFATFQKGTERYETKKMLKGVGRTKTLLLVSKDMIKSRYADKAEELLHYRKGRETHF